MFPPHQQLKQKKNNCYWSRSRPRLAEEKRPRRVTEVCRHVTESNVAALTSAFSSSLPEASCSNRRRYISDTSGQKPPFFGTQLDIGITSVFFGESTGFCSSFFASSPCSWRLGFSGSAISQTIQKNGNTKTSDETFQPSDVKCQLHFGFFPISTCLYQMC